MTFPSLPMNPRTCRPCWTSWGCIRWEEVSHCQHSEVRGNVLQFQLWKPVPPVLWRCNASLHGFLQIFGHGVRQAINLNTAVDAALCPFTTGTFRVKEFVQKHDLSNRLHVYIWLLKTYAIPAGMYASQIWATPYLQQGKEMDSPLQKWLLAVLKRMLGVRDTTPSWCVMRECGLEPLQFYWLCTAMRLYNSLTKSNSYTMKKVLHADMHLSTRSNDLHSKPAKPSHCKNQSDKICQTSHPYLPCQRFGQVKIYTCTFWPLPWHYTRTWGNPACTHSRSHASPCVS